MAEPGSLYLEDLPVGRTFHTASTTVDTARIKAFAAEFDPQPFHLDETAAGNSLFGGLVASGWHTAALTMRLLVDSDFRPAGGLIGLGVEEMKWPRPVKPGDTLQVESVVLEARASNSQPNMGLVKLRSTTRNQDGHAVMVQVATLIVPRLPS